MAKLVSLLEEQVKGRANSCLHACWLNTTKCSWGWGGMKKIMIQDIKTFRIQTGEKEEEEKIFRTSAPVPQV